MTTRTDAVLALVRAAVDAEQAFTAALSRRRNVAARLGHVPTDVRDLVEQTAAQADSTYARLAAHVGDGQACRLIEAGMAGRGL